MNLLSLINKVKYSPLLYNLYYYVGNVFVSALKLFLKTDEKLIVFNSYGGRKYDDSPKAIFEKMLKDPRFNDYKLIWAFLSPDENHIPVAKKIKSDTLIFYYYLVKARVWVTNSSMTRGLDFRGKNTFILNTWHSTTVKKIGSDVKQNSSSFKSKSNKNMADIMLAQGEYDVNMLSRVFDLPKEIFRVTGFPRNDELVHAKTDDKLLCRNKLNIPEDKTVILYAPTFREYEKDNMGNCVLSIPVNFKYWEEILGDNYVILVRAHYEVVKVLQLEDSEFIRNVSSYSQLNDLLIASDILISDYSSIFVDYSILGRPMLCYAYDYERYEKERGLCFDIRAELSSFINDENTLLQEILNMDINKRSEIARNFCAHFIKKCGHASEDSLNIIYDAIS